MGAGAIENYSGDPLTATLPVTAESGGGTNQVPTFTEGASATRSFAENTAAGQNIGNPVSAADSDGGTLSYSLEGTDASSFALVSTSGQLQTRTGVIYDFETKNRYEVSVRVSDGQGGSTTIDVTINLTDVGEPQANPELYWTDAGTDKIQRANLDGSNVEDLRGPALTVWTAPSGSGAGRVRRQDVLDGVGKKQDSARQPGRVR